MVDRDGSGGRQGPGNRRICGEQPTDRRGYAAAIWDPATGQWTLGASAVKPRLYHSIALLLPDGSVLTGAGGAPGPVKNLNAEMYYPGYLYDGSGQPATRPSLVAAPDLLRLQLNPQFAATVASATPISRVTFVHTGAVTHTFDPGWLI